MPGPGLRPRRDRRDELLTPDAPRTDPLSRLDRAIDRAAAFGKVDAKVMHDLIADLRAEATPADSLDALRAALHDTTASMAFLRSVIASGERLNAEDEARLREVYDRARAALGGSDDA